MNGKTRNLLWDVIAKLREEGLTVFLTTHYMEEASSADYVIIIDEGKIAVKGTPLELKRGYANDLFNIYTDDKEKLYKKLIANGHQASYIPTGISITIKNTEEAKTIIKKYDNLFNDFKVLKGDMNSSFVNSIPEGFSFTNPNIPSAFVAGWIVSVIMSVSAVTVSIGAGTIMVQDKLTGAINDFNSSPVKKGTVSLSYI